MSQARMQPKPFDFWTALGGISFLVGFFLTGTIGIAYFDFKEYQDEGITTQATITEHTIKDGSFWTEYLISYRYEYSASNSTQSHLRSRLRVSKEYYSKVDIGSVVEIRYLKDEPKRSRILETIHSPRLNDKLWMPGLLMVGLALMGWGTIQERRKKQDEPLSDPFIPSTFLEKSFCFTSEDLRANQEGTVSKGRKQLIKTARTRFLVVMTAIELVKSVALGWALWVFNNFQPLLIFVPLFLVTFISVMICTAYLTTLLTQMEKAQVKVLEDVSKRHIQKARGKQGKFLLEKNGAKILLNANQARIFDYDSTYRIYYWTFECKICNRGRYSSILSVEKTSHVS